MALGASEGPLRVHFGMEAIRGEENHFRETLAFSLSDLWAPTVAGL